MGTRTGINACLRAEALQRASVMNADQAMVLVIYRRPQETNWTVDQL